LRYLAGGVGSLGNPGQADWNATLGRHWAHDYSERIVPAPGGRAWMITRYGSYREYIDANGDGLYEKVSPEDEYRTLTKVATGWSLRELDGTVTAFDSSGLWLSTTDRNGNAKTATYSAGRLATVSMPDGRSERFSYDAAGKLATITEIGADGTTERVWSYIWAGQDLTAIERPDATGLRFTYSDSRHPGFITRWLLVGADGTERVEAAWEYDSEGNVVRSWRGADDAAGRGEGAGRAAGRGAGPHEGGLVGSQSRRRAGQDRGGRSRLRAGAASVPPARAGLQLRARNLPPMPACSPWRSRRPRSTGSSR
jgi:YD repeat-containing protein